MMPAALLTDPNASERTPGELQAPLPAEALQDETVWEALYNQPPVWREWLLMQPGVAFTVAAMAPALRAGWVWKGLAHIQIDDSASGWLGLAQHWRIIRIDSVYRPVAFTSWWLLFALWKAAAPACHHAVGLILHLVPSYQRAGTGPMTPSPGVQSPPKAPSAQDPPANGQPPPIPYDILTSACAKARNRTGPTPYSLRTHTVQTPLRQNDRQGQRERRNAGTRPQS